MHDRVDLGWLCELEFQVEGGLGLRVSGFRRPVLYNDVRNM